MKKFKIFWDFAAEEKYLNQMAKEGYLLKKYTSFGFYHFEDDAPQDLNYKIDYRIFKTKQEFDSYMNLFEDAGWKHVYGTRTSANQYFLPMTDEAGTDIFSDKASAAQRYKTLSKFCTINLILAVCYLTAVLYSTGGNLADLGFLTPGLWDRTGTHFWFGFFFELPFVVLRILPLVIFVALAVVYGYWAIKAKKAYAELVG